MKVVINFKSVGLSCSNELFLQYCRRIDRPMFVYLLIQEHFRNQSAIFKQISHEDITIDFPPLLGQTSKYTPVYRIKFSDIDLGDVTESEPQTKFNFYHLDRTDETLIEMVEEGLFNYLKVVEIPDDMEWYIDEENISYDEFREIVREKPRIFR